MSPAAANRARVQAALEDSGRYQKWVLLTALAGMFATTFPITLLAVTLTTIAEDFDTSESLIAWVISGPMLGAAVALPILGKLGDLYGHRRIFLIGFTVSIVVTAFTVFAWDPYSLIALRGLAVVIGAATMPSSMALINSVYAPTERAKAMGWWALVAAVSPAIGLVIGGPLIEAVGWRPMFGIQAVLSIVPVGAAFLVLKETARRTDVGFDIPGALTIAVGAGGTMLAINQFNEQGASPLVVGSAVAGVVGIGLFVLVESKVAFPLLPLGFFRRRNFSATLAASFFAGAAYMGGFIVAPSLLQSVLGYTVGATSLIMLFRTLAFALTSPIGGSAATRLGERPLAVAGTLAISVSMVGHGLGAEMGVVWFVAGALVLQGLGNGLSQPPLAATLSNSVDEADLGVAAAAQRMAFQVGSAVGITTMTSVYGGTGAASDVFNAYLVGAAFGVAASVFAWMIRSTPRSAYHTAATEDPQVPAVTVR